MPGVVHRKGMPEARYVGASGVISVSDRRQLKRERVAAEHPTSCRFEESRTQDVEEQGDRGIRPPPAH